MRLFIAEKSSAAKDLAAFLGVTGRGSGYLTCGNDQVTWCVGHLFELAYPEDYDPSLKTWAFGSLPIVPDQWKQLPITKTKPQLAVIGSLLKSASEVVNFGDADNEGQLLVDDVLEHFKCRKPTSRLFLQALDPAKIAEGLDNLKPNSNPKFVGMRDAAIARSRADWLVGMNLSRAYTLLARARGEDGTRSVGRVQTPTLALVHTRCEAVRNFKPIPFHTISAKVAVPAGELVMRWRAKDGQRGLDTEGRLIDTATADALVAKLKGAAGQIAECEQKDIVEHHPRLFSLTSITTLASKVFGYKAAQVLATCQALYETYKLTSYPRTDCDYMPESQHAEAPQILAALAANIEGVDGALEFADTSLKSKTWNDAKITAHHGIAPRPVRYDLSKLTDAEQNIYQLIARAYLAQFFPLHEYRETKAVASLASEDFTATGKVVTSEGWRALYRGEEEDTDSALPALAKGDAACIVGIEREDKKTKPPQLFTEGTLMVAMENIHTTVEDSEDKKVLKEAEGIGQPSTRAAIIEELKRKGFLCDDRKFIVSTPVAAKLLADLPDVLKSPVLAAGWERKLRLIERNEMPFAAFVSEQVAFVSDQVQAVKSIAPVPTVIECPTCKTGHLRRRTYQAKSFWSCSNYPDTCRATFPDSEGKPFLQL